MMVWFWKNPGNEHMPYNLNTINREDISTNLFITGFVSTSVQLLLMREIMNISGGYELITGVFFGSWLISSAAGSAVAGKCNINDIRKINLAFSLSQIISVLLLFVLSRLFLESGESPGFIKGMIITFIMLLPFCFFSGFTFIKLTSAARTLHDYVPGKSFSIETTGGIVAGVLLTILTSGLLNTGQILLVIIILSLSYTLLTFYISDRHGKLAARVIFTVITVIVIISKPDVFMRQMLMPGIEVTGTKDTPYGNITKGSYGEEKSIYYNQRILSWQDDAIEREENIHYAMLQAENPEKVILISGSLISCLPELMKYNLKKVIYVERDPGLTQDIKSKDISASFSVIIETEDAYRFIKRQGEIVDAVILLLPPPSTLALNRYYTKEFFQDIKSRLSPGGVFMCSPGPGDYYMSPESVNLYSSVFNSIADVFRNIIPVAGNKLYFIASDSVLTVNFCDAADRKGINNVYVSSDYMADDLIKRRSDEILAVIDSRVKQNTIAFPISCFYYQSYHLSRDSSAKNTAISILILVFVFSFLAVKRQNFLMYFAASSLAGFEIVMLLIIQLTVGHMYQLSGIIIASLMTGLAAGSGSRIKKTADIPVKAIAASLLLFYALFAFILDLIFSVSAIVPATTIIVGSIFIPSFITGYLFRRLTGKDNNGSLAASVYSSDLAGSALGFILISAVMIPVFGIKLSIFLLSGLIFAGILFGTNRNKY